VLDIATSRVVHEEPGPERGGSLNTNGATALVASPDRTILAVAFGKAQPRPVAL
jgi:hypothetical protein